MRLLLVEDEAPLAEAVRANLTRSGYAVDWAMGVEDGETALAVARYDAVLLDLRLRDGSGLDLLRTLRRKDPSTPVLILSALDAVADRVAGLDAGADDYLNKPFAHEELLARIRALLRRPGAALGLTLTAGRLSFDVAAGLIHVGDRPVSLTRRERTVLETLLRRPGAVIGRDTLDNALYGFDDEVDSNALEAAVSRLRHKLAAADAGLEIKAVRGLGYLLREQAS